MNKNQDEIPLLKKFLISIIMIILLFMNSTVAAYAIPNKTRLQATTYQVLPQQTQSILVIDNYKKSIAADGYNIISITIDKNKIRNRIMTVGVNGEIKNDLIRSLDVQVSSVQLKLENDDNYYYFKNQEECEAFLAKLNSYDEQKYTTITTEINYTQITSSSTLENKITELKNLKEEKEREQQIAEQKRKNYTVTSRSGSSRTTSTTGNAPLASYVYISSGYGTRWGKMHTGIDLAAAAGTEIYAWKSGTVTFAGWSGGYGNFIIVDHGDGTVSRYGHCSRIAVSTGQSVAKGQTIGYVGSTGNSTR
jgi:murein DD-endopeptidase MepM/ murein hydrolase activator NlpD